MLPNAAVATADALLCSTHSFQKPRSAAFPVLFTGLYEMRNLGFSGLVKTMVRTWIILLVRSKQINMGVSAVLKGGSRRFEGHPESIAPLPTHPNASFTRSPVVGLSLLRLFIF